jgi:hypothetical protein
MLALCVVSCRLSLATKTGPAAARSKTASSFAAEKHRTGNLSSSVNYSALSKMLAGVMVLREGGIGEAIRAIPHLSVTTHHFLQTQVCSYSKWR